VMSDEWLSVQTSYSINVFTYCYLFTCTVQWTPLDFQDIAAEHCPEVVRQKGHSIIAGG